MSSHPIRTRETLRHLHLVHMGAIAPRKRNRLAVLLTWLFPRGNWRRRLILLGVGLCVVFGAHAILGVTRFVIGVVGR